MVRVIRCLLTSVILLYAQGTPVCAENLRQQSQPAQWEQLLDRYELICRKCITLKQRQETGEAISSRQLLSLMDELEKLRSELKDVSDKMPAAARQRYNAIRQMYLSGEIIDTRQEQVMALGCKFLPTEAEPLNTTPLPDIGPIPVAPRPWEPATVISGSVTLPELSYGISGAYWGPRFGAWGAVRSTFTHHSVSYDAHSDGSRDGGRIWVTGKAAADRLFVTAGPLIRLSKNLALFGGAGYGIKRLCWEDSAGEWMLVRDISGSGVCFEAGTSVLIAPCSLSLSWLYLPHTCHTVSLSVGINLH